MENSGKKSGDVEIPKRKRSLDLKSLYKSRASEVGVSKKKVSEENGQETVKKKKRKEVSLSSFEPDAKKSRTEDGNGMKLELGSTQKLSGGSIGLHGISFALGDIGIPFNFPKRPRGSVGRKKLETDRVSEPLGVANSVDHAGAFNGEVIKLEDKVVTGDRLVTLSALNEGVTNSAGNVSGSNSKLKLKADSKSTGKGSCLNVKLKQKADSKSTGKGSCSNVKLKQKADSKSTAKGSNVKLMQKADSKSACQGSSSNGKLKQKADSKSTSKGSCSNVKLKLKAGAGELKKNRNGRLCPVQQSEKEEVIKPVDKAVTGDRLVRLVGLSVDNDGVSNSAGRVSGSNSKLRRKADTKSTGKGSSSKVKLKQKAGADDHEESGNGRSCPVRHSEKEVIKPEDAAVTGDRLDGLVGLSVDNDGVSNSRGKVSGSNSKLKKKAVSKFACKGSGSKVKLKQKAGAYELKASRKGGLGPIRHSEKEEVIKPEDEAVTGDRLVGLVTLSADNDGVSKSAGKVSGSNSKLKQKADSKSTGKGSSSKAKLKQKAGADELKESRDGRLFPVRNSEKEVTKPLEAAVTGDRLDRLVTLSADKDGVSNSGGNVSGSNSKLKQKADSKSTRKGSSSNVKSKQKANSKSTGEGSSSNVKLKRKAGADELKVQQSEKEDNVVVNNGDTPSKKLRRNSRKKNDLVVGRDGGEASKKKFEPSVGSLVADGVFRDFLGDDEDDDDEENLEQNAARMLSSRFDPSCTGFSSKRKSSVSQTANGFSFQVSSSRDSFVRRANSSGVDSGSADDKSRGLRPRSDDKGKGVLRKRRHFYEDLPRDLDAYWFLNRRIKVFWPLDESWYYGLVNDYHPECKLHHIKYDDRDEEWVDLQEEKFKLLLYPSEVPGKTKSKRRRIEEKDSDKGQTVPPADDDSCIGNDLDSEPIALWLARSSKSVKSLPKSLKTQRTSHMQPPMVSSLSPEKTDNLNSDVDYSKRNRGDLHFESTSANNYGRVHKSLLTSIDGEHVVHKSLLTSIDGEHEAYVDDSRRNGCDRGFESASANNLIFDGRVDKSVLGTPSSEHVVYVRKKYQKKGEGRTVTPLAPVTVSLDSDKQLWSLDDEGLLRLNLVLVESKEFRFQLCLPVLQFSEFSLGTGDAWLLHNILMLQHGVMLTTFPAVILEILFIDRYLGLRFLLFEGCMKQALAFVSLILTVFSQPDDHWNGHMQPPMTSIRFRLSSAQDPRKHQVFEFHCFSRMQSSKWVYLDSKLLQHCILIKQLPASECTYNNIKELEYGRLEQCKHHVGLELSSYAGFKQKFVPGILPMGVSREARDTKTSQSALSLAAKSGKVPQFALSFSDAPTFFLTLHLQLLMENSFAWVNLQRQDALCSPESLENGSRPVAECPEFSPGSVAVQDINAEHESGTLETEAPAFKGLASSEQELVTDVVLVSNVVEKVGSSENLHKVNPDAAGIAGSFVDFKEIRAEVIDPSHQCEQSVVSFPSALTASPTSNPRSDSRSGCMIVDVPIFEQVDMPFDGKGCISRKASGVGWNVNEGFGHSPNPAGSRSSWKLGRSGPISSPDLSPVWPDGRPNFTRSGFSNGPKKPRTQVQYTVPFAGYDISTKQQKQNQRALPCKRIRRASLKRISDGSRSNQKNLELLACRANVLVTHGDKGWRESGAHIVLEVADHNEWKLAVKLSGITKYSYKVKHVLQPGSTNRFSHAMLWKGGKDWVLEFPDRSQWMLFKEMHEECHNRNVRAASVKNIPIPGVRLVEESDYYGTEILFAQNFKYFQQVQTDVEMAMDPSHVLYDMDSDDEQWLMANKKCTDKHRRDEISEDLFEKTMDMFEKVSYVQHRDNFTEGEIKELVVGIASMEAAQVLYEHWREKRERKGMPLIRHLQPPLWERYQQQLKEWENTIARGNSAFSVGNQEKFPIPEKPPMFAFCLKPRGLDVPNKGSKQRSHRKFSVSVHHRTASGDHESHLVSGRRSNGHAFGDEKVLLHESSDVSPSLQASTRVLSPRDSLFSLNNDMSEWNRTPKFYKSKSKKLGSYPSSHNQQTTPYNLRTTGNSTGVQQGLPELSTQRRYYVEGPHRQRVEQFNGPDVHEFRVRDASDAAQRALKMAKLKREKAQRLLYKADLAIHKAAVALMTAEAMKAASENSNGDHSNDRVNI